MPPVQETPNAADRLAFTDIEIARAIGASITWVRHDRRGARLIPYYRVGGLIRYNRDRVLAALSTMEEGGAARKRKGAAA